MPRLRRPNAPARTSRRRAYRDAATAAAVTAAAAVIAESQPDHTELANPYPPVADEESAPADIAAVQNPVVDEEIAEDPTPVVPDSSESSGEP
ncbi:hypothetical protein QP028_15640 [Corynebacterium suedekumii]|nr:hypothetical protein QP028_15640 [Corynebacterium suedekumii]